MADDSSNNEDSLAATAILSAGEISDLVPNRDDASQESGAPTQIAFPQSTDQDDLEQTGLVSPQELEGQGYGGPATYDMSAEEIMAKVSSHLGPQAETHVQFPTNGFDDWVAEAPMPVRSGIRKPTTGGFEQTDREFSRDPDASDPTHNDSTVTGAVFEGRFRVDSLIGEGGMGRVYKGVQLSVGRPVAIKVLHQEFSQTESLRQRFMREARLISSFTHPNTVRLYDFGETDGHLFIAMEYVEGVPLSDVIARGPVSLSFAFTVLDQVCGSLVEAHKADVVHRDVKPDNIVLFRSPDDRLQVKLLDFGIAHIEPENDGEKKTLEDLTQRGVVVGTVEYMAPEQARGTAITSATDVYALGVILYELVSGELPISGRSKIEALFALVSREATPIRQHLPDCPPQVQQLVHRFLQKEPEDRVPSAAEVRSALRKAAEQLGLQRIGEVPDGDFEEVIAKVARDPSFASGSSRAAATDSLERPSPTTGQAPTGQAPIGPVTPGDREGADRATSPREPTVGVEVQHASTGDAGGRRVLLLAAAAFVIIALLGALLFLISMQLDESNAVAPESPVTEQ